MHIASEVEKAAWKAKRMEELVEEATSDETMERGAMEFAERGLDILCEATTNAIGTRPDGERWMLSGQSQDVTNNIVENAWVIEKVDAKEVGWMNENPIFTFLDQGTRAHGPVTAKALFIPLTRKAAWGYLHGWRVNGQGRMTVPLERRQRGRRAYRELEYGVDYVLAKRVKGITPRRIVLGAEPDLTAAFNQVKADLLAELEANLKEVSEMNL